METNNNQETKLVPVGRVNNKKKKNRIPKKPKVPEFDVNNMGDILNKLNNILKDNPTMMDNVGKCVNNIMKDQTIMNEIQNVVKNNLNEHVIEEDNNESGSNSE